MIKAVFPGTFDPPTLGHMNLISRGNPLFDSLHIVIAENQDKKPLLPDNVRRNLIRNQLSLMKLDDIEVTIWDGLIVDYCRLIGAKIILRGIRSSHDFDYEYKLASINRQLAPDIETILLPAEPHFLTISSSTIKELIKLGGDTRSMIPPEIETALKSIILT